MTRETMRKPSIYAGFRVVRAGKTAAIINNLEMKASTRSASFLFALATAAKRGPPAKPHNTRAFRYKTGRETAPEVTAAQPRGRPHGPKISIADQAPLVERRSRANGALERAKSNGGTRKTRA